ncbi:MAG: hypothetical protein AAGK17_10565 [Pseudomonadota bacterium]
MAKTQKSGSLRVALWLIGIVFCALAAAFYAFREPIGGYAEVGTSYAARVACSCRFVAGRPLGDCEKDKLAGMELVTLVEDVDAQSVTARFPLVTATTAQYREGYGCVLEKWED